MRHRRGLIALVAMMAVASSSAFAQDKKLADQQDKEKKNIRKVVDDLVAASNTSNDFAASWVREDFLKAQGNKEYVPFTVSIDPSKVPAGSYLTFYWRVVLKGDAAAAAPTAGKKDDKKDKDKDSKSKDFPYEDIAFVTPSGQGPLRVARSFTVGAGTYDVFVLVKEPTPDKAPKNAPALKMSLIKQSITVPDYWNSELSTSSVIVAQRIDPLAAPLTPQQQADRPYAMGTMEITPYYDMKFKKTNELSTFMLIYNPKTDASNKPDVTVEYNFYQKPAGQPEKFFNKTNPQSLNAQTLPPQFDLAAGHQLQSGQAVPLASFPEGDYRLEIKVTDKLANKTLTRDVNFTVNP